MYENSKNCQRGLPAVLGMFDVCNILAYRELRFLILDVCTLSLMLKVYVFVIIDA